MNVALRKVEREGQENIRADSYHRVVAEEELRGIEHLLFIELEWIPRTSNPLLAGDDVDLFGVEDIERMVHFLKDKDRALCEVVKGINPFVGICINFKMIRGIENDYLLIFQQERGERYAGSVNLSVISCVNKYLHFASEISKQSLNDS